MADLKRRGSKAALICAAAMAVVSCGTHEGGPIETTTSALQDGSAEIDSDYREIELMVDESMADPLDADEVESSGVDLTAAVSRARESGFSFEQSATYSSFSSGTQVEVSSSVPTATGHLVRDNYVIRADLTELLQNGGEAQAAVAPGSPEVLSLGPLKLDLWVVGDRVVMDKTDLYELFSFMYFESSPPSGPEVFDVALLDGLSALEIANVTGGFFSGHVTNPNGLLEVASSLRPVAVVGQDSGGILVSGSISYTDYVNAVGVVPRDLVAVSPVDILLPNSAIGFEPSGVAGETPVEVTVELDATGLLERVEIVVDFGAYLRARSAEEGPSGYEFENGFRHVVRTVQTFHDYGAEFTFDVPEGIDRTEEVFGIAAASPE